MFVKELAALEAAEKTDEKKPLGGDVRVPPGVLVSSAIGVGCDKAECASLPGWLVVVADLARRWIKLPDGVTMTLGLFDAGWL